jgi:hypothetical protein
MQSSSLRRSSSDDPSRDLLEAGWKSQHLSFDAYARQRQVFCLAESNRRFHIPRAAERELWHSPRRSQEIYCNLWRYKVSFFILLGGITYLLSRALKLNYVGWQFDDARVAAVAGLVSVTFG